MNVQLYSDDDEEENVVDGGLEEDTPSRDSIVFAIECCQEIFEGDDTHFNRIIDAIHDMFLNKIITSDRDLHGIIFFGTEQHENSSGFSNIVEWMKLDVPSIKSITQLREMRECDKNTFQNKFGFKSGHQISEVLWECLNMFSSSTPALKTLLMFSWNDNPHFGDDNAQRRAKAKAIDLHEHNVDVQVLSFNPSFKHDAFYKDLVSDPESIEPSAESPIDSIQNLYNFLLRKCTKQRPYTKIPWRLGKDVELSVGVYTVARRATKSATINIDSRTNQEVRRHSSFVDSNTGEILMPSDIKYMQKWGDREIVFEKEEVQQIKTSLTKGHLGLRLLGFKPRKQAIKPWYHVRNAQFIYPDEKSIKGSTTLFRALLTKCLERDVVAICNYVPRAASAPRLVALLPQAEEIDPETSQQMKPPGFFVIFLPFADDIRKLEIERNLPEPSEEQVQAAEALIKRLKFPFNPENFDNPVIQTHYKNLEAMALGKDQPDPIDDHTKPDNVTIEKKAGAQIKAFKELVFPPGYSPKTTQKNAGSSSKKKEDVIQIDVTEYIAQDKLAKLTVQSLKEICRENNIKTSGKKADIIKTIEEHFK